MEMKAPPSFYLYKNLGAILNLCLLYVTLGKFLMQTSYELEFALKIFSHLQLNRVLENLMIKVNHTMYAAKLKE